MTLPMRQVISAIVSLAIALLVTASGIYFDVQTLTVAGVILFGLAAILWLFEWGRSKRVTPQEVDASERDRKRELLDRGRSLAATYTQGHTGADSFREYLEGTKTYAALRGHLSKGYTDKLNNSHMLYAKADGARYEPLVEWFLDDLHRLEHEWRLS
jgi:hypothetical protein